MQFIEENKIVAICRKIYGENLLRLAEALEAGGVKLVEVTFDQGDPQCQEKTFEAIASLVRVFSGSLKIGAGTVLNEAQVHAACDAGAEYIISPNTNVTVIQKSKAMNLVSIPGAFTPSEILTAHENGADIVKVFPVNTLGLDYIKNIKGPINHVKLMATAGVTPENLGDYLKAGFCGAGISGYLSSKKLIDAGQWNALTQHAAELMSIVRQFNEVG